MKEIFERLGELAKGDDPHVLVTLVSARGHAPSDPGAKAIVLREGLCLGTIGGGKVEARAILKATELIEEENHGPCLMTWNLQTDIGMTCGGEVTFLFETFRPRRWEIAVFGAGHVSQALVRALLPLDCRVTCVDARAEWIAKLPTDPKLTALALPAPAEYVGKLSPKTHFVVMTQGHATDVPILHAIFTGFPEAPYIGVIGSSLKATKIRSELSTRGISAGLLERLRCPMGLPIGSNDPAEIAVSITAELLQIRDKVRATENG